MSVPAIVRQHAEDAATKWWLRRVGRRQPHTAWAWQAELDDLIDAHLGGLLEGGALARDTVRAAWQNAHTLGAADADADGFVLVALTALDEGFEALQACARDPRLNGAINDWLSWSPDANAAKAIELWSQDARAPHHAAALRYLHIHGLNGGDALRNALYMSGADTLANALDAVAHCGRVDLAGSAMQVARSDRIAPHDPIRFAAARAALLLGEAKAAVPALQPFAHAATPQAFEACQLLSLALPTQDMDRHIDAALQSPTPALAAHSAGWAGRPRRVPWLIEQMQHPPLAAAAKEAFCLMLGIEVAQALRDQAERAGAPERALDADQSKRLADWWAAHRAQYDEATPHLAGHPATPQNLRRLLVSAPQGVRDLAALRQMLASPGTLRFPTHAHVALQWQRIEQTAPTAQPPHPPPQGKA